VNSEVSSTEVPGQGWGSQRRTEWKPGLSDLQSQLEELRVHVWDCEADWRLDDRIELAVRAAPGG
jgi:hypothetical protein